MTTTSQEHSGELAGLTQTLAEYVGKADLSALPDEVLETTRRAMVDTVGVTIAARRDPGFQTLRQTLQAELPTGRSTVLATGERTSAAMAALLNGAAGHALDFDDVTDQIYGHPSVVLVPTVLAVAEAEGAGGRDAVEAYVLGFQVDCAVAAGSDVREHYQHGWHSTATIGVLGATAAAARLMHLDNEATRHALGIAASTASGSRQNFGSMTKPLHPGLAARDAVLAASLARNGFTADPDQLEGPLGYFAMYTGGVDASAVVGALEGPWALIREGLNVKKYACCYNTHRTADAILGLTREEDLEPGNVANIRLTLEPGGFDPLIHRRPVTGLQGKFSPEYVLAAAVLDGRITLASFLDEAVQRPEISRLVPLVSRHESATPPFGAPAWEFAYAAVEVECTSGQTFRRRVDVPRGDARDPVQRTDLEAKFRDCVRFSEATWDPADLLEELWHIDSRGASGLLRLS
jgi:2-methylcitrate dehydratase PrpD